jgi:hypothetical protein
VPAPKSQQTKGKTTLKDLAAEISETAMLAYELAVKYTNHVMSQCIPLQWANITAMRSGNPTISAMAMAVAWCADAVQLAANKGLLPNASMLDEARECEWRIRQIEHAIVTEDQSMLENILRSTDR